MHNCHFATPALAFARALKSTLKVPFQGLFVASLVVTQILMSRLSSFYKHPGPYELGYGCDHDVRAESVLTAHVQELSLRFILSACGSPVASTGLALGRRPTNAKRGRTSGLSGIFFPSL